MKYSDPLLPVLLLTGLILGSGGVLEGYARHRDLAAVDIDVSGEIARPAPTADESDDIGDDLLDEATAVSEEQRLGRAAAQRGDVARAIELFEKAVNRDPRVASPLLDLGCWLRRTGRLDESLAALERARLLEPASHAVAFQLAASHRVAGHREQAERELRRTLALKPAYSRALLALANLLRSRGALPEALDVLGRAASLGNNAERATALVALGRARCAARDWNGCLQAFHSAVDRAPADASVRIAIAKACLSSGQKELQNEARVQGEKAALLAPDSALYVALLGWVRERTGDRSGARLAYERALQMDPRHTYAERKLLHLDLAEERLASAQRRAERLVERSPSDAENHFLLALVESRTGQLDQAREHYRAAIERANQKYPEAYFNLGRLERSAGNVQAAIAHYEQAIALNPDYLEALNNLALAVAANGDQQRARSLLEKAIAIDPRYAAAWVNLGELFASEHNLDAAAEAFSKAIAARPRMSSALIGLARVHRDRFELDRARDAYRKALELKPKAASVWLELAEVEERRTDLKAASEAAQRAAELDPDRDDLLLKKAELFAKLGQSDSARSAFEELIERAPTNTAARIGLAEVLQRVGDVAGCAREAQRALGAEPSASRARQLLERCSRS